MDLSLKKKLEGSIRKKAAPQIREKWKNGFANICGCQINDAQFISLEKTVALKQSFFERIRDSRGITTRFWKREDFGNLESVLNRMAKELSGKAILLFSDVDQILGALEISVELVLTQTRSVWRFVGEDLAVADKTLEDGLCLELSYYTSDGVYWRDGVFELSCFGVFQPFLIT